MSKITAGWFDGGWLVRDYPNGAVCGAKRFGDRVVTVANDLFRWGQWHQSAASAWWWVRENEDYHYPVATVADLEWILFEMSARDYSDTPVGRYERYKSLYADLESRARPS